jgi:D-alanyl-lipoteichoic acid acyltransferase DltB (MBOAT superfamily)
MGLPDLSFQSSVALPIGISFYIFHSLSYCIDVYRGGIRPTASWRDYLLYVAFFPQLVAGPIVRWTTMGQQIETPRPFLADHFILGVALMVVGLFQKIVLADGIFAPVANTQFDQSTFDVGVSVWMGALAFTGQIFCDFAGYTTCAIGAALVLGFRLPVNFQSPYAAIGFSDFWRRWHISLSSWLRDYLYISLGGNRGTAFTTARNLMITMLLGGLWHGAAWTFVVWGLLHGLFLLLERGVRRLADRRPLGPPAVTKPLGWCITLIAVMTAWVFFRADDLVSAVAMVTTMFSVSAFSMADLDKIDFQAWWAAAIFLALLGQQLITRDRPLQAVLEQLPWPLLGGVLGAMLFLISTTTGQSNAFIYFQF